MSEKFSTSLQWHQIKLDQIHQLLEVGEMIRGVGLAQVRLEGLRQRLSEITEEIDTSDNQTSNRLALVKEEQRLQAEIRELEILASLIN